MCDVVIQKKNEVYLKLQAEPHVLYELAGYFTFDVPGAKFSPAYKRGGWNGKIQLLSTVTGEIYCGLLDRVIAKIKNHGFTYEFKDSKYYGSPFEYDENITLEGVKGLMTTLAKGKFEPYDYQIRAVYECLRYNRKTIVSPTSSGKTFQIYSVCRYYLAKKKKILIIFPTTTLIHQTYKDWEDFGFASHQYCHLIYAGQSKDSDAPIFFSTWQSLTEQPKSFFEQFDVVIIDEVHKSASKSLIDIMKKCHNVKYRFGFTGTLTNNDDSKAPNELTITGLFGPAYATVNTKELIEKGRASKLDIHCLVLKHKKQNFGTYEDEIQYLITHDKRNKYIRNLSVSLKGNTLLMFSRVETHGEVLYNLIKDKVGKDRKVFFIHGGVDGKDRESIREIVERENNAIIVASYNTMSTGVSIKKLNNIIFGFPSKGKIRVLQTIGRGLRKAAGKDKAVLYDIADDCGNNYTLNHFAERIKLYNEEGFDYEIFNLDLDK